MNKAENTDRLKGLTVVVENSSDVHICSTGTENQNVEALLNKITSLEHQRDKAVNMCNKAMGELNRAISLLKIKDNLIKHINSNGRRKHTEG